MEKKEIGIRLIWAIAAIFFFLHSLKLINFLNYEIAQAVFGFESGSMNNAALFAILLLYAILAVGLIYLVLLIISYLTKKRFNATRKFLESIFNTLARISKNRRSEGYKIITALILTIVVQFMFLYLGFFECATNVSESGAVKVTYCPPFEQSVYLAIAMVCLVHAIFPYKITFKKAKTISHR